jgi:phosphatidylglycerol---prolipoprotein diacylglyceryl transferase
MPFLVLQFPQFDPIAVSLGPFAIRWYALAYIVGIVLGWVYARKILRTEKLWGGPAPISVVQFDDYVLWVTLGIILGGRAGYVLFYNLPHFIAHPLEIFQLWQGGMSFHGGFLGCVAAVLLFGWRNKVPALSLGDVTCAVGTIGLLLGRLANFINSELWGRVTDVPWAFVFPTGGPLPRHPSQLYEAALEGILLFAVLTLMIRRGALLRPGLIVGSFAILYGLARIFSEFFREPDPQLGFLWGGLTMGMLLSLPMIAAGLAFVLWAVRRPRTSESGASSGKVESGLPKKMR